VLEIALVPTIFLICINALMAWTLWYPMAGGQLSMGAIGVVSVGAYTAGYMTLHGQSNFFLCVLAGAMAAALASIPLGLIAMRLEGFTFAIVTLGLVLSLQVVIGSINSLGGAEGLIDVRTTNDVNVAAPILLGLVIIYSWSVWRSRLGRTIDVMRSDSLQARALAVPVTEMKFHLLIVAGLVGGATGAILTRWQGLVDPTQFGFTLLTQLFAYVVVGGIGTFWGPIFGAAALTLIFQLLAVGGTTRNLLFGAILVISILARRDGVLTRSLRLQRWRLGTLLPPTSTTPPSIARPARPTAV